MRKAIFILSVLFIVTLSSCIKKCDEWHEGTKCNSEIRSKYYGTYSGNLTGVGSTHTDVSEYPGQPNRVYIGVMSATLTDETNFTIPIQVINISGVAYTANGAGYFSTNGILYNYDLNNQPYSFVGFK